MLPDSILTTMIAFLNIEMSLHKQRLYNMLAWNSLKPDNPDSRIFLALDRTSEDFNIHSGAHETIHAQYYTGEIPSFQYNLLSF